MVQIKLEFKKGQISLFNFILHTYMFFTLISEQHQDYIIKNIGHLKQESDFSDDTLYYFILKKNLILVQWNAVVYFLINVTKYRKHSHQMYVMLSTHNRHQGENRQTQATQKPANWPQLQKRRYLIKLGHVPDSEPMIKICKILN